MTGNCHVRCGAGENLEIISKNYLSLFGKLLDFKKTISVVRGYGINCQIIVQSIAQLSDRYPIKEWEEIVGNCDTQLVLGCNDMMTSEYISKRCGAVTIQLTNSMAPQTPLFSPITREVTGYRQTKTNNTRPLMYPEEILQMDNRECLVLIRGQKPLKGLKIIPDELSDHRRLKYSRVADYIPKWRKYEEETNSEEISIETEPIGLSSEDTIVSTAFVSDAEKEEKQPIISREEIQAEISETRVSHKDVSNRDDEVEEDNNTPKKNKNKKSVTRITAEDILK